MEGAQQAPRLSQVLDDKAQAAFAGFFAGLPPDGTVRLFQRTAGRPYYSCHGPDAELLRSTHVHLGLEVTTIGSSPPLPTATFGQPVYDELVSDLLAHRGRRVELWVPDGDKKAGAAAWRCAKRGSPGNLQAFEDDVAVADVPVVMALTFTQDAGRIRFGAGYCNPLLRRLGTAEFLDGDQFLNLEAFVLQVGAKECLVPQPGREPSADELQIRDVLHRANVVRTELKRTEFAASVQDLQQDLGGLVEDPAAVMEAQDATVALPALGALLRFLDLRADDTNAAQFTLRKEDLQRYMRLGTAAVTALNVFPTEPGTGARPTTASLYGLLNRCRTVMGQRTLRQWLSQPPTDVAVIRRRQDLVEIFSNDPIFCDSLREGALRRVPDLDTLQRKMQRRRTTLADAVALGRFVGTLPEVVMALRRYDGDHRALLHADILEPLQEDEGYFDNLTCLIENTLDVRGDEALIQPGFDDALEALAEQRRTLDYGVNKEYKRMLRDLGITDKVCKVDRTAQHGFFWKMHRSKSHAVPDLAKRGYEVLGTTKGGMQFTNGELRRLNGDYATVLAAYRSRQGELEKKFLETVASYSPVIEDVKHYLTLLDLYTTFAYVARTARTPYVRPVILGPDEPRRLSLTGARHPMLEAQDMAGGAFIPNDVDLRRDRNLGLITGPNMGGKSTYIRTVGVIQLLAQIGMPVPCAAAVIPVCDGILARVGAADSQARGVSTFMAEMLETASILANASDQSLVIIDELGRGTSTYDGFGLAWAICEAIACRLGSHCLFATHFHELTRMATGRPNVANLHVTADTSRDHLTMLYRVQPGPCEKSFGIHVAELVRFPPNIIACAKRKAEQLEDFGDGTTNAKRPNTTLGGHSRAAVGRVLAALAHCTPEESLDAAGLFASLDDETRAYAYQGEP